MNEVEEAQAWCKEAIGHTEEEVREAVGDNPIRVTKRDGRHLIVTRDFKSNRVNLEVENGIVTKVSLG